MVALYFKVSLLHVTCSYYYNTIIILSILTIIINMYIYIYIYIYIYTQWGKKVFSQPSIVQVLPLKKMRPVIFIIGIPQL